MISASWAHHMGCKEITMWMENGIWKAVGVNRVPPPLDSEKFAKNREKDGENQ